MIKGIVVYYSATGNTQQIARAIHAGMKQVIRDCDIGTMKELNPKDLTKYDLIGLGAPLWRRKAPPNVQIFIHKMPSLKGKLGFMFCTHGTLPVSFMHEVGSELIQKGMKIIGYNDWYGGVHQLAAMPKPYPTDGHPDEIDLAEAEHFGRDMAERAAGILPGKIDLIPDLPEGAEADPLWQPYVPSEQGKKLAAISKMTQKQMRINIDKCTYPGCTLCIDHCPMNSIDFSVSPPVFKSGCAMDLLCESICPTGAIEVNYEPAWLAERDHVRTVFVKLLKEAEAKGRFRWLVPLEKVGFDTPGYKVTGHPRYILPE